MLTHVFDRKQKCGPKRMANPATGAAADNFAVRFSDRSLNDAGKLDRAGGLRLTIHYSKDIGLFDPAFEAPVLCCPR